MSAPVGVVVHSDPAALAAAAAARLVTALTDAQYARGVAHVVLTGGSMGIEVLASLRSSPARSAVDWGSVHVWWGDERFLPAGHTDRNETQAREALLDHVPLDPTKVHPMAAAGSPDGLDPESAASAYTRELASWARSEDHGPTPRFDVLLLGMGPDGHVASLFPDHASVHADDLVVTGVRGAPKPPPSRVSLTLPTIRAAAEVWFVVTGADKAARVRMALEGAGERQVPAAGARGRRRTLWLLDRAAAAGVPPGVTRISSP